jgi:UDP-N-acetylmuramyl pentapeptide phosphotransferase/UDP-N-acetylglucosamine-1-phosphate transferase
VSAVAAAIGAVAGAVVTRVALSSLGSVLGGERHLKTNFRGRRIPGTAGIVLVAPAVAGGAAAAVYATAGGRGTGAASVVGAAVAMGLLGLADDLYGSRRARGFLGHARSLVRGEPTTGALKAGGGAIVGLAAAAGAGVRGWWILPAGALVALAANLVNLLDVRPGRAAKAWLAAFALLVVARPPGGALVVSAAVAGGVVAFLPVDIGERGMLGDAGANLLGAALGAAAIASLGHGALVGCLAVLVALTGASEAVSFSRVIERVRVLRALDDLGRPREPLERQEGDDADQKRPEADRDADVGNELEAEGRHNEGATDPVAQHHQGRGELEGDDAELHRVQEPGDVQQRIGEHRPPPGDG